MKWLSYIFVVMALLAQARPSQAATKPGDVDLSFDAGATFNQTVYAIALQTNDQPVITGSFSLGKVRLNTNGQIDGSFQGDPGVGLAVAIQPDGKIIVDQAGIVRLNTNGSLDSGFQIAVSETATSGGGTEYSIVVQPDGKILIGGYFYTVNGATHVNIARLNANGSLDTSFQGGTHLTGIVYSMALQPDGKVLIGGDFQAVNNVAYHRVARLNTNGSPDLSFQDPMVDASVQWIIEQPDGKVLIGGQFGSVNGVARSGIARLNGDGSLDTSFQNGMTGTSGTNNVGVFSMALQPDGEVLICGGFDHVNDVSRHGIARLNADGSLDTTFQDSVIGGDLGGPNIECIALQSDGKVIIGGAFDTINGVSRHCVARLYGKNHEPVITLQPKSQVVSPGSDVTFGIIAKGDATLLYQWCKNETNLISGATNLSLTLTNVQKSANASYSVIVSNAVGWTISSNAILRVNLPPVADASATLLLSISDNGYYGEVTLDGSLSHDPDGDPLQYDWSWEVPSWFGPVHVSTAGELATTELSAGVYSIQLVVNDGAAAATNTITVVVKVPPVFSNFGFSEGQFGFAINGGPNEILVEASTNLLNWVPLSTNTLGFFQINFIDADSSNFPRRFYRARIQ